jgi:predicted ATPase
MLSRLKVQRFKSLFDTEVKLEPLTVFIGPNGSGKSNICEAIFELSSLLKWNINSTEPPPNILSSSYASKVWQGNLDFLSLEAVTLSQGEYESIVIKLNYYGKNIKIGFNKNGTENTRGIKFEPATETVINIQGLIEEILRILIDFQFPNSGIATALRKVKIYDFFPTDLVNQELKKELERSGKGIVYSLVDILHSNRKGFDELEQRLTQLVPNIKEISLPRGENQTFFLELIDKYSEHPIPASDVSDGTLRLLAFLTALYQKETPSIICFEELENGVHPWLLHKMMELLKIVSTDGINGKPVQVLITTHSPLLLNYVEPYQVRAVELDHEGKTQVHALPLESKRFQKALEAYDGELGELWFTNVFGGNPA